MYFDNFKLSWQAKIKSLKTNCCIKSLAFVKIS